MIESVIQRPIAVWTIALAYSLAGLFAIWNLPTEIVPSADYPRLTITTSYGGASPAVVEANVTSLIESEMAVIPGIKKIKSFSYNNISSVTLDLDPQADVDYTRFVVQEHLGFLRDRFPSQVAPPRITAYVPEQFKTSSFMSYHILGDWDEMRLSEYARKYILPALSGLAGVAGAEIVGGRERQIRIGLRDRELEQYGLNNSVVASALRNAAIEISCGRALQNGSQAGMIIRDYRQSLWELKQLIIARRGAQLIRLDDVAEIIDTISPAGSYTRINHKNTIMLQLEREGGSNTVATADRVEAAIARLKSRFPQGFELLKEDDQSIQIRENLRTFIFRAIFSFFAVFLTLLLFLTHIRAALYVQLSILISTLSALLLIFVFKYSLNLITLAGLALGFGILVDNSIVVTENIFRHRQLGLDALRACAQGTREIIVPLFAATLTTIAVLLPFLYLMDDLKLYYTPFAVTVMTALILSLITAFFFIPATFFAGMRGPRSLKKADTEQFESGRLTRGLHAGYRRGAALALRYPKTTLFIVFWFLGYPLWLIPKSLPEPPANLPLAGIIRDTYNEWMDAEWVNRARPALEHLFGGSMYLFYRYVDRGEIRDWGEETRVDATVRMPMGTDIEETNRILKDMEATISGESGIFQVRGQVYPQYAHMEVRFTEEAQHCSPPFIVKEKLILRATRIGNAVISVQGLGPGFSTGGGGMTMQNRLIVSGYNYHDLDQLCLNIRKALEQYPRVQNVEHNLSRRYYAPPGRQTSLRINREAARERGVDATQLIAELNPYLFTYLYRQKLKLGSDEVNYAMQSENYRTFDFFQLKELPLRYSLEKKARLKELMDVADYAVPREIEREDQRYYRVISFDYLAPWEFTEKFIKGFVNSIALPPGYAITRGSGYSFWHDEDKTAERWRMMLLALLLMYMVLAGLYESFRYPLLVFMIIPVALIGVFLIFYLTDTVFNQAAFIGMVLLLGIVVNNAIIYLDHVRVLRRSGGFSSLEDLLIRAGCDRIRPILMTSLTTIAGLLPMVMPGSGKENDLWYTLSLGAIGGLFSSVLFGLFVLPACLLLIAAWRAKRQPYAMEIPGSKNEQNKFFS